MNYALACYPLVRIPVHAQSLQPEIVLMEDVGDAIDFSNKTCSIDHPPGSSSPENYRTWAALGKGITFGNVDSNASDFTWYDTYVRQTIPFVVSAQFAGGIPETQVACVAPKKVVEGGRRPADRSAASLDWRSPSWLVISVAMVVNAAFAVVWD